jgi:hypothetical protein
VTALLCGTMIPVTKEPISMKKNIPPGVIVGAIVVAVVLALFIGFRKVADPPDMTQNNLDYYKKVSQQRPPAPGETNPAVKYSH